MGFPVVHPQETASHSSTGAGRTNVPPCSRSSPHDTLRDEMPLSLLFPGPETSEGSGKESGSAGEGKGATLLGPIGGGGGMPGEN